MIVFGGLLDKKPVTNIAKGRIKLNERVGGESIHIDSIHVHVGAGVIAEDMATSTLGPDSTGGPAIQGTFLNDAGSRATEKGQHIGSRDSRGFRAKVLPVDLIDDEAGAVAESQAVPSGGALTINRSSRNAEKSSVGGGKGADP